VIDFNATLTAKIRSDCTNAPVAVLSEDRILEALQDAVRVMNERIHNRVYRVITTVADQQRYTVNSVCKGVLDVYRDLPVSDMLTADFSSQVDLGGLSYSLITTLQTSGVSWFLNPSLYLDWQRKIKAWQKNSPRSWDYIEGELWLIPPPGESGDLILYVSDDSFSAVHMPAEWEYMIKWFAIADCLRHVATRRWNEAGVNSGGGLMTYSPQKFLADEADKYEKKFEKEVDRIAMMYSSMTNR